MIEHSDHDSTTPPAEELRRRQQERLSRFFIGFAIVEGLLLGACVLAIYVLGLIDPEIGIWLLLGVAAVSATVLTTFLMATTRRNQRELEQSTDG